MSARRSLPPITLLCWLFLAISSSSAQQFVIEIDPVNTVVAYSVDSTLHTVHGTFKAKAGKLTFDGATGTAAGAVVVDVTSGASGNNSRDSRMQKEILESAKYPEATFTAQRFSGKLASGDSKIQVSGLFNLHGQDHPLTLSVITNVAGDQATAKTEFDVPYVEWGIKNPSNFLLKVNKVVKVEIAGKGTIKPTQP